MAQQTAASLREAGIPARVEELGLIDAAALRQAGRVLFIVSTTGEGDAPDGASAFVRHVLDQPLPLASLHYGLLALGDREYRHFCAFGHRLDGWLRRNGAAALFDLVEVDDGDEGAIRHWQHQLGVALGRTDMPDWESPPYQRWRLVERRLLNAGSVGGACFHIALQPMRGVDATWRAGDVVEIGPRHAAWQVEAWLLACGAEGSARMDGGESLAAVLARSRLPDAASSRIRTPQEIAAGLSALPQREYSIASTPADGAVHLLVRRFETGGGHFGLGSGWLTTHAPVGGSIDLRIRTNRHFHAPDEARPLILIGNGTGIAGLRALLRERIAAGRHRNWLLFGERQRAHDFHYRDEIEGWLARGRIEKLDLAFSRDQATRVYVQDVLRAAAHAVRAWVQEGAAIYVCGSLEGMAPGVDAALTEALGSQCLAQLLAQGRYRRDVY